MCPLVSDTRGPCYQTLQIELTNRCNLNCRTCLRAVPDIDLQEQDFGFSALQQLQPALQRTASVHLQGWGESMLLDDLVERIRWFRSQGCRVSFTTNGSLMSARQASQLVTSGLDSITFSMAGATAGTQDSLRGEGTHAKLLKSLKLLQRTKQEQGSITPALAVSYLLTPETIEELPQAVKQCRSLGLSLFAGVHLTHAATEQQKTMHIYSHCKEKRFRQIIRWANWQALLGGMHLHLPPFKPELTPVCDKDLLAGCFIAADGSVAPCVFLYPPTIDGQEKWFTDSGELPVPRKRFGTLNKDSLDLIWQSSEYRAFRKPFQRRLEVYEQEMAKVDFGMDAIQRLERAKNRIRKAFLNLPVPECCSSCPKMEGF